MNYRREIPETDIGLKLAEFLVLAKEVHVNKTLVRVDRVLPRRIEKGTVATCVIVEIIFCGIVLTKLPGRSSKK